MGTQRQKEILLRVADGKTLPGDSERLQDVGWTMTDSSLCGLGQTAAGSVLSAIKLWPSMFEVGYRKGTIPQTGKKGVAEKKAKPHETKIAKGGANNKRATGDSKSKPN